MNDWIDGRFDSGGTLLPGWKVVDNGAAPVARPSYGTTPGMSGWCLVIDHGGCIYPACTCTCHEKEGDR